MSYSKTILTPTKSVAGNIRDLIQSYEIIYYPRAEDLIDKVAVYIYLGEKYAKRSIYFSSVDQFKEFIFDLSKAYFYFVDKRIKPDVNRSVFRNIRLEDFLHNIRIRQVRLWRNDLGLANIYPRSQTKKSTRVPYRQGENLANSVPLPFNSGGL